MGWILALALLWGVAGADTWRWEGPALGQGTFLGTEVDSAGHLALGSFRGANLALGATALSGENTLTGSRSVTDGDPNTEWRFNNESAVLGEWI